MCLTMKSKILRTDWWQLLGYFAFTCIIQPNRSEYLVSSGLLVSLLILVLSCLCNCLNGFARNLIWSNHGLNSVFASRKEAECRLRRYPSALTVEVSVIRTGSAYHDKDLSVSTCRFLKAFGFHETIDSIVSIHQISWVFFYFSFKSKSLKDIEL